MAIRRGALHGAVKVNDNQPDSRFYSGSGVYRNVWLTKVNPLHVPNGDDSLTFCLSGPGQLVGLDKGDPTDTTSYKGTSRKAFNGKALAIVRSTKTAGNIAISASASGLSSSPLTMPSQ